MRRVFLSHLITLADVERPTPLDPFSGAELARLVRLVGVRETARAARAAYPSKRTERVSRSLPVGTVSGL